MVEKEAYAIIFGSISQNHCRVIWLMYECPLYPCPWRQKPDDSGCFLCFCPVLEINNISTEPKKNKKKTVYFSCMQLSSEGVTLISDEFTVINANMLALLTVCRPLADFWPQQCCYWSATLIVFLVFVETIPLFADIPPPAGWHWTCVGLSTHGTEG